MVWWGGAEGAFADEPRALTGLTGDGGNFGDVEGFVVGERREDAGQAGGEQGFTGAGRSAHEEVMPTGGGDLQGALDVFLAAHVVEVVSVVSVGGLGGGALGLSPDSVGDGALFSGDFDPVAEGVDGDDLNAVDQGGFFGVDGGDDDAADGGIAGGGGDGEDAADVSEFAVEGEFAHEEGVADGAFADLAGGDEHADGDGEVVAGALLADVGGGEVDGDALGGEAGAGVADGGADALAGFVDGGVGEADDGGLGQAAGDVDFDADGCAVEADDGSSVDSGVHGASSLRTGGCSRLLNMRSLCSAAY